MVTVVFVVVVVSVVVVVVVVAVVVVVFVVACYFSLQLLIRARVFDLHLSESARARAFCTCVAPLLLVPIKKYRQI